MSNGAITPPPPAAPAERTQIPVPPSLSDDRSGEWVFRAVILVVVAVSLALAWWSFARVLSPSLQESRRLVSVAAKLSDQVDALTRQFGPAEEAEITNKLVELHTNLFDGQNTVEPWLADFKTQGLALGLDIKAEIGKPVPQPTPQKKISVVPASLSIDVQPGTNSNGSLAFPCQRLLRLSQILSAQPKRIDVVELNLSGGPYSISHAAMVLNCWVNEE